MPSIKVKQEPRSIHFRSGEKQERNDGDGDGGDRQGAWEGAGERGGGFRREKSIYRLTMNFYECSPIFLLFFLIYTGLLFSYHPQIASNTS